MSQYSIKQNEKTKRSELIQLILTYSTKYTKIMEHHILLALVHRNNRTDFLVEEIKRKSVYENKFVSKRN